MQNKIDIGTIINLQDLLQSRLLIQANSGGGKSVLARTIIEQVFGVVPFIVLDIEGEYYTLKEKFGDVLVIGGQHADIPISMQSVKLLPKEIISNRLSVILDVSDLQMSDRILYARDFLERMVDLPKEYWINYLVFIEEAHKLCGEQDKQASAAAVKDLMSRGRKRGYCGVLLTQRISKLHKDAAAECNNKFIGRTFLDIDLDRSAKELGLTAQADKAMIRNLQPGCFYAFGTSIEPHEVHEVKINLPQTKIPKAGVLPDIKPKAPTDKIKAMLVRLNDIENTKPPKVSVSDKNDGQEILSLKNDVQNLSDKLYEANFQLSQKEKQINHFISVIEQAAKALGQPVPKFDLSVTYSEPAPYVKDNFTKHNEGFASKVYSKAKAAGNSSGPASSSVSGGALRMLKAAAMFYPNAITKMRMATLSGLTATSGTFGTYLSTLQKNELLKNEAGLLYATKIGLKEAGEVDVLPTDPIQLIEMWCDKVGNQSGAARMLRVLGENYPNKLTREQLGKKVEMVSTSGSFGTYISTLKRNGLIVNSGGYISASSELFQVN